MKKTSFIVKGLLALAIVLGFTQCANNNAATQSAPAAGNGNGTNMKIAYVEIDSLLTKYNFWNDLNEQMIKKEENIRTTLNEKGKKLEKEAQEFQRKYENNGFVSPERAQQEYQRIQKQQLPFVGKNRPRHSLQRRSPLASSSQTPSKCAVWHGYLSDGHRPCSGPYRSDSPPPTCHTRHQRDCA